MGEPSVQEPTERQSRDEAGAEKNAQVKQTKGCRDLDVQPSG